MDRAGMENPALDSHRTGSRHLQPQGLFSSAVPSETGRMGSAPNQPGGNGRRFLQPAPARARADRALLERYHAGDPEARHEVMERFLPLARQIARRYVRGSEPIDDLIQVARV